MLDVLAVLDGAGQLRVESGGSLMQRRAALEKRRRNKRRDEAHGLLQGRRRVYQVRHTQVCAVEPSSGKMFQIAR